MLESYNRLDSWGERTELSPGAALATHRSQCREARALGILETFPQDRCLLNRKVGCLHPALGCSGTRVHFATGDGSS